MGVDQSTSSSPHTPKRTNTLTTPRSRSGNNIYAQMAKKVMQSKDELFQEHSKRGNGATHDSNLEIYYDFLTHREPQSRGNDSEEQKEKVIDPNPSPSGIERPPLPIKTGYHNPAEIKNNGSINSSRLEMGSNASTGGDMKRCGSIKRVSYNYGAKRGTQPVGGAAKDVARSMSSVRGDFKFKQREQPKQRAKKPVHTSRVEPQKEKGRLSQTVANTNNASVISVQPSAPPKPNATMIEDRPSISDKKVVVKREEKSIALRQKYKESFLPQFDKVSLLPPSIFIKILGYVADNFRVYLRVNPSWYIATMTAFDNHFNALENDFVTAYSKFLLFKDSYTSSSVTHFCGATGIRIDRVLRCENLSTALGKALTISYTYKYVNEPKTVYRAEFVFDSVSKAPNCIWMHKNECQFHMDEAVRANTQPIVPICVGDNIEIAVNYYSLRGLVDVESVKWLPPYGDDIPLDDNVLTYQREKKMMTVEDKSTKLIADLSRICELEDSEPEWRSLQYEPLPEHHTKFMKMLEPFFVVKDMEYSNVDILVLKIHLLAARKGEVPSKALGIGVRILDYEDECTNEVKRTGLLIERHCDLEVRTGDMLIFYLSTTPQPKK